MFSAFDIKRGGGKCDSASEEVQCNGHGKCDSTVNSLLYFYLFILEPDLWVFIWVHQPALSRRERRRSNSDRFVLHSFISTSLSILQLQPVLLRAIQIGQKKYSFFIFWSVKSWPHISQSTGWRRNERLCSPQLGITSLQVSKAKKVIRFSDHWFLVSRNGSFNLLVCH